MKLGLIQYSNSYPFLLEMKRHPIAGVDLEFHIPTELNRRLRSGALDMSAVSAFEYLQHEDDYFLLPKWCINSKGFVKSVLLFSKFPLDQLDHKRVMLTQHSATSVHLLHILIEQHHIVPQFEPHDMRREKEADALLLIGDPALRFQQGDFVHVYDLAEEWKKMTQLPIVFAVQAIRRDCLAGNEAFVTQIQWQHENVIQRLKAEGLGSDLVEMKQAFPDLADDFENYFRCLDFTFSEACHQGLRSYADQLVQMGFLSHSPSLTLAPL